MSKKIESIIKYCLYCNKEMININRYDQKYWLNKNFCNRTCKHNYIKKNRQEKVICEQCGETFDRDIKYPTKYCSAQCGYAAKRRWTYKCPCCGKGLLRNWGRKYCSDECKDNMKKPASTAIIKVCPICNKEFTVAKSIDTQIYCSRECFSESKKCTKNCLNCKKEMEGTKLSLKDRKFCSPACFYTYSETHSSNKSRWEKDIYNYVKIFNPDVVQGATIKYNKQYYFVDLLYKHLIIELLGDYWHCNPFLYNSSTWHPHLKMYAGDVLKKDQLRFRNISSAGFICIGIWEWEWYNKKDEVLEICRNFLRHETDWSKGYIPDIPKTDYPQWTTTKSNNYSNPGDKYLQKDKMKNYTFIEVETLGNENRGGFGSTGTK